MRRSLGLLSASVIVLAACGSDSNSNTPADTEDCDPQLDKALTAWEDVGFSGSIAISNAGELDCVAGYGMADQDAGRPNTPDTVFSIGSVTKTFTAAGIGVLVDQGQLSLDDRAGDLITDLTGPAANATVEQLLQHRSGLTGSHGSDHEPLSRDEAIAAMSQLEQAFPAGSDYLYSNAGYSLLALIIEQVSGRTYRDFTVAEVLALPDGGTAGGFWDGQPAATGQRAVGYLDDGPTEEMGDFGGPHWALDGNGSLAMSTKQLAAWMHGLFTGQLVPMPLVEALSAAALDNSSFAEPVLVSAGGGGDVGHNVVVAWLPESERVVTIATNTADILAEELFDEIGTALVAGDHLPTPAARGEVDPDELTDLAGTYELDTRGSVNVAPTENGLALTARGLDAVAALFPLPDEVTADDAAKHEAAVEAFLAGETEAGTEERAALESDIGPIEDIELAGSLVEDGELRTYVVVTSANDSIIVWYALDQEGGLAAALVVEEPPTLVIVPVEDGSSFEPINPAGSPDVTVSFDGDTMTLNGPMGSTRTQLAG